MTAARGKITVEELAEPPDGFLAGELEGYEFYKAFQEAGIDNFELGYFRAWRDGVAVATAPFFVTRYRINTTLKGGWLKRLAASVLAAHCVHRASARRFRNDRRRSLGRGARGLQPQAATQGGDHRVQGFSGIAAARRVLRSNRACRSPRSKSAATTGRASSNTCVRIFAGACARRRRCASRSATDFPTELGDRIYELYLNVHRRGEFSFETLNPSTSSGSGRSANTSCTGKATR